MNKKQTKDLLSATEDGSIYRTNTIYKNVQSDIKPKKSLKNILNDFFDEIFEYFERL